jgi:hypothetical protein
MWVALLKAIAHEPLPTATEIESVAGRSSPRMETAVPAWPRDLMKAPVFDWKVPLFDWEAPVFDCEVPVFDREAPVFHWEAAVIEQGPVRVPYRSIAI